MAEINEKQELINTYTNTIFAWLYKLENAEERGLILDDLIFRLSASVEHFDEQVSAITDEEGDNDLFLDDFTNAVNMWWNHG